MSLSANDSTLPIPFNRAVFAGREFEYMRIALERGHVSGDGPFSLAVGERLCSEVGSSRALLTPSCTAALEMTALLLDIHEGDEVIVPAFTFVSSVNAFVLRGAQPVFADIRPDTLNLDEARLESLITPRTRAIIVVHYAGVACEMDAISAIAARHGIPLIEDNAHGLMGAYRGRPLGSFGRFSTLSFHETKNLTCGEGGALLINDPADIERAEIVREKGTDRSRFFRGQVDKYGWVDIGSSFLLSDLLAACLLAQLENVQTIQGRREEIWLQYHQELSEWAARSGVRGPVVPAHCRQPFHMYYMLLPDLRTRQRLIDHLKAAGILAVFHYLPLNRSRMAERLKATSECPVAENASDRLLRLPLSSGLSQTGQRRVIDAVLSFR
ncbi:MAG: dTDP-4-amino-4,6-dideoxygalactose transaminase [Vicinamibacteria bacterium]|nr:dTDP-4-amino-4,6-dideoxygalactose transaminase [Vicinamibacteria bacterium]